MSITSYISLNFLIVLALHNQFGESLSYGPPGSAEIKSVTPDNAEIKSEKKGGYAKPDKKNEPGRKVPISKVCRVGHKVYEDGETWKEDCNTCRCEYGRERCTSYTCEREGCAYKHMARRDEEKWYDDCNICVCNDGRVRCQQKDCRPDCEEKHARCSDGRGRCRPNCYKGEEIDNDFEKCNGRDCSCCVPTASCDNPYSSCSNGVGKCRPHSNCKKGEKLDEDCDQCKGADCGCCVTTSITQQGCWDENHHHIEGSHWKDDCNTCSCHNGVASCTKMYCQTGVLGCTVSNKWYDDGESWMIGCSICWCDGSKILCSKKNCNTGEACEDKGARCSDGRGRCRPKGICNRGEELDENCEKCKGRDCGCCVPAPVCEDEGARCSDGQGWCRAKGNCYRGEELDVNCDKCKGRDCGCCVPATVEPSSYNTYCGNNGKCKSYCDRDEDLVEGDCDYSKSCCEPKREEKCHWECRSQCRSSERYTFGKCYGSTHCCEPKEESREEEGCSETCRSRCYNNEKAVRGKCYGRKTCCNKEESSEEEGCSESCRSRCYNNEKAVRGKCSGSKTCCKKGGWSYMKRSLTQGHMGTNLTQIG